MNAWEDALDISPDPGDEMVTAFGIGGRQIANRPQIESIELVTVRMTGFRSNFGSLSGEMEGLIGIDLLTADGFSVDFTNMKIHPTSVTRSDR